MIQRETPPKGVKFKAPAARRPLASLLQSAVRSACLSLLLTFPFPAVSDVKSLLFCISAHFASMNIATVLANTLSTGMMCALRETRALIAFYMLPALLRVTGA